MSEWNKKYRMSFATIGLSLNETIDIAKLHQPGEPWSKTSNRAIMNGIMLFPKESSNRRAISEITSRLKTLSEDDLDFLINCDYPDDKKNMLWIAFCRSYRIIREFLMETINDRCLSGITDLQPYHFNSFIDNKSMFHEELESIGESTRTKSGKALFRLLRNVDIIDRNNQIQGCIFSDKFIAHLEDHNRNEASFFPFGNRWMTELKSCDETPGF